MFNSIRDAVRQKPETIQVEVDSQKLIPSLGKTWDSQRNEEVRTFFLEYDGHKHPCLNRGWVSWAQKMLVPEDDSARRRHGLIDSDTQRRKRWSTSTVRRFLEMSPLDIANAAVKSWWERHEPTSWHVIKYVDNGSPGPIRFIGTNRYRLYRHRDFLADLSKVKLEGMSIKTQVLDEDRMLLRITDDTDPIPGTDIFSGWQFLNSENGSSAISVKHMIFDLICTNGMIDLFDAQTVVNQRHTGFDMDDFRISVRDVSESFDELHKEATSRVSGLVEMKLEPNKVQAVLDMCEDRFEVAKPVIDDLKRRHKGKATTAWEVLSTITRVAQDFGWDGRLGHEQTAGRIGRAIMGEKFMPYFNRAEERRARANV